MAKLAIMTLLVVAAVAIGVSGQHLNTLMEQPLMVPGPGIVATVLELIYQPGELGVPPHYHPGPIVGYVVEGEILFQVKGREIVIYPAGSTFYELDGDVHLWGANASNSTVCRVIVNLLGRPGQPIVTFLEGEERLDYQTALAKAVRKEPTTKPTFPKEL